MNKHIPPPTFSLSPHQRAQAAGVLTTLRRRLLEQCPDLMDDPRAWLDTLDGETDAIDVIRNLIRASIDADVLAEATRKRQAEIAARAERVEHRKQAFRDAAVALMDAGGITKLPEPDFTARVQAGQNRSDPSISTPYPPSLSTPRSSSPANRSRTVSLPRSRPARPSPAPSCALARPLS